MFRLFGWATQQDRWRQGFIAAKLDIEPAVWVHGQRREVEAFFDAVKISDDAAAKRVRPMPCRSAPGFR